LSRKLGQRLALKNKMEEELRGRIDQLEKRQTQDDAVINVINRSLTTTRLTPGTVLRIRLRIRRIHMFFGLLGS
jgi:hypothetical protein